MLPGSVSDMTSQWAVITGASSGIGACFARELARRGSDVLLAARNGTRLAELAEELRGQYAVDVRVRSLDLAADGGAELAEELRELDVHTLVNNAGFGTAGRFAELDGTSLARQVSLNVAALTELSHAVAPAMVRRGRGAIINVASTAAFQPVPEMAVYAATKAYVLSFTVALWEELHPTGVRALAVCPGPTDTAFFDNMGDILRTRRRPEQVVASAFTGLKRHQPFVVDGAGNYLLTFTNRFAPVRLSAKVARRILHHT